MVPRSVRVTKVCSTKKSSRARSQYLRCFQNAVVFAFLVDPGFQYRQCLEFLDEMTEMGIQKNVIIFGAAMSCMEKCSRADIGFQLMKRMKEDGIQPNVHIFNSAISACARSNLWEKGYELYLEMERVGVKRDVVTYNAGKGNHRC